MSRADAVHDCGRQLLLALGEVVIQRPGLDVGGLQDLVHPRRRIALPAEQHGRGVDQRGPASIRAGHSLTLLERSLNNTRKLTKEGLRHAAADVRGGRRVRLARRARAPDHGTRQAIVRPVAVACCDLDVACRRGTAADAARARGRARRRRGGRRGRRRRHEREGRRPGDRAVPDQLRSTASAVAAARPVRARRCR